MQDAGRIRDGLCLDLVVKGDYRVRRSELAGVFGLCLDLLGVLTRLIPVGPCTCHFSRLCLRSLILKQQVVLCQANDARTSLIHKA